MLSAQLNQDLIREMIQTLERMRNTYDEALARPPETLELVVQLSDYVLRNTTLVRQLRDVLIENVFEFHGTLEARFGPLMIHP